MIIFLEMRKSSKLAFYLFKMISQKFLGEWERGGAIWLTLLKFIDLIYEIPPYQSPFLSIGLRMFRNNLG